MLIYTYKRLSTWKEMNLRRIFAMIFEISRLSKIIRILYAVSLASHNDSPNMVAIWPIVHNISLIHNHGAICSHPCHARFTVTCQFWHRYVQLFMIICSGFFAVATCLVSLYQDVVSGSIPYWVTVQNGMIMQNFIEKYYKANWRCLYQQFRWLSRINIIKSYKLKCSRVYWTGFLYFT